jgi:hypothetical protein
MSCGFEVLDLAALMFMGLDMLILSNQSAVYSLRSRAFLSMKYRSLVKR